MNNANQDDRNRIPKDDDPAYDNPVGKLPPRTDDRNLAQVRQPFDLGSVTVMHSEGERLELERKWAEDIMPELRTREMRKPLQQLEALRMKQEYAIQRLNATKEGSADEKKWGDMADMYGETALVHESKNGRGATLCKEALRQLGSSVACPGASFC
jgi:hypothetical protein